MAIPDTLPEEGCAGTVGCGVRGLVSEGEHKLTRCLLVRSMRDQDGGAHFDDEITDPTYAAAIHGKLTGFNIQIAPDKMEPVPYALEVSMRQIAEEVRLVLQMINPELRDRLPSIPQPSDT